MDHYYLTILSSNQLEDYFLHWGYIGIFLWFITIDQIAPLPEEITLIVIGYFSSQGILNPFLAGIFSVAAFLTVDLVYYFLTKSGNKLIGKLTKRTENTSSDTYKGKLRTNMPKTLLVLCFIPRMRLLAPVFVALTNLPFRKFIFYDTLGLCIFCTVYISIGIIFHRSLASLISGMGAFQHIIFGVSVIIMGCITIYIMRKRK